MTSTDRYTIVFQNMQQRKRPHLVLVLNTVMTSIPSNAIALCIEIATTEVPATGSLLWTMRLIYDIEFVSSTC